MKMNLKYNFHTNYFIFSFTGQIGFEDDFFLLKDVTHVEESPFFKYVQSQFFSKNKIQLKHIHFVHYSCEENKMSFSQKRENYVSRISNNIFDNCF